MHAKVVTIDVCGDGHGFEEANKELVDFLVVELLQDLLPEREMLSHGARLVIAAQHDHISRVVELQAEEKDAHLQRKNTAVHIITQEKQVRSIQKMKIRCS